MKNSVLCMVLALVCSLLLLCTAAAAEPNQARIGDVEYTTLAEAVAAAKSGDTISLLCDVNLSETASTIEPGLSFTKEGTYTLLGNGYTLTHPKGSRPLLSVGSGVTLHLGAEDKPEESVLVLDGTHVDNKRTNSAVYVSGTGVLHMYSGVTVCNNKTIGGSGSAGIELYGSSALHMHGGSIRNNTTQYLSSAIYAGGSSTLNITGGEITGNHNTMLIGMNFGAVAVMDKANASVKNCRIANNTSAPSADGDYAGAVSVFTSGNTTIENCSIQYNGSASAFTGGVLVFSAATITNTNFTGNTGMAGGAVLVYSGAVCTVDGGKITGNNAQDGGGLAALGGKLTVTDNTVVYGNTASNSGDDLFSQQSEVTLPAPAKMEAIAKTVKLSGWFDDDEGNRYHEINHAVIRALTFGRGDVVSLKVPYRASTTTTEEVPVTGDGFNAALLLGLMLASGLGLLLLKKRTR